MFANFSIIPGKDASAPAVPQRAIVYEGDTARISAVGNNGSIAAPSVRTGRIGDCRGQASGRPVPGEKDVTSGALSIDRAAGSEWARPGKCAVS